jgi:Cu-processing system ATP-binding protein
MTATVELDHVSKRYGAIEAVSDVSLDLGAGETTALVGHNGAGKTTLMKLMLGLVRPSTGRVRVLGDDPAIGEFEARRKIGYLPENVSFNTALTGHEILSFYARLKRETTETTDRLLDLVGLGAASRRRVGTYSKGMRQRLGLAQALIGAPQLLLLDEPTTGLDPALRQSFYEIMRALRDLGATVILSSHALAELGDRADRVVIMGNGKIIAQGSTDALRRVARLPTKIRLTMGNEAFSAESWLGPGDTFRRINGHIVEIDAGPERKIELLRRATEANAAVTDVEVTPPTLDELYVHFLRQSEPAL